MRRRRSVLPTVVVALAVSGTGCHGVAERTTVRAVHAELPRRPRPPAPERPSETPGEIFPWKLDDHFRVHEIGAGESLSILAHRYDVAGGVAELARDNALRKPYVIRQGAGLKLRATPKTEKLPPLRVIEPFTTTVAACPMKAWPLAVERPADADARARGCDTDTACSKGPDGSELCVCHLASGKALMAYVDAHGVAVGAFETEVFLGDRTNFLARSADLDDDGRDELVVAVHRSTGCGMSAMLWDYAIFPGGVGPPLRYTANEMEATSFVARDDSVGCDAFVGEWAWLRDPLRGDGLYAVHRRYRFQGGALVPVRTPVMVERVGYADRQAWRTDPLADFPARTTLPGRFAAMRALASDESTAFLGFDVTFDVGGSITLPSPSAAPGTPRVGDRASGVAYPEGYVPADPQAWLGARVELVTYAAGSDATESPVVTWVSR